MFIHLCSINIKSFQKTTLAPIYKNLAAGAREIEKHLWLVFSIQGRIQDFVQKKHYNDPNFDKNFQYAGERFEKKTRPLIIKAKPQIFRLPLKFN